MGWCSAQLCTTRVGFILIAWGRVSRRHAPHNNPKDFSKSFCNCVRVWVCVCVSAQEDRARLHTNPGSGNEWSKFCNDPHHYDNNDTFFKNAFHHESARIPIRFHSKWVQQQQHQSRHTHPPKNHQQQMFHSLGTAYYILRGAARHIVKG